MKRFVISMSTLIVVMLIIGTYIYQKQAPLRLPEPISSNEQVEEQEEVLQPVDQEEISYTLQQDALHITYNHGDDWIKVPIERDLLFAGEHEGNEQALIEDSYILTKERVAFLYREGIESDVGKVVLTYSLDQGDTWQESVVTDSFSPLRFRQVAFLNETFGYVILSGGRTMSDEYSIVYLTHDGGENWEATAEPPTTRLIAFGAFVDEQTGFLSYGTINPEAPDMYTTQDGGETWVQSEFHMPEKYHPIFVQAEAPIKEQDHLSVLVNQGPNGDYEGGHIKGKFTSEDNGRTWDFSKEVEPSETE